MQLGCPHAVGDLLRLYQRRSQGSNEQHNLPMLLGLNSVKLTILRSDEVNVAIGVQDTAGQSDVQISSSVGTIVLGCICSAGDTGVDTLALQICSNPRREVLWGSVDQE